MRSRLCAMAIVVAFLLLFSSFSVAETTEQQFVQSVHEFHMARANVTASFAMFGIALNDVIGKGIEVPTLRDTMRKLDNAVNGYSKASNTLSEFLSKNAGKLKGNAVAEWAQNELKVTDAQELTKLSNATMEFVNSIREMEFTVYANEDWANSSLSVSEADFFVIRHDGEWTVSPSYPATNYQGYPCEGKSSYGVLAGAPLGALIYRVRGSGNPSPMMLTDGKGYSTGKGRLEFMINDSDRRNNKGQLNLKIVVYDREKLKAVSELGKSGSERN